jgi:hypothetical protein
MSEPRKRRWLILSHAYNVDGRAESVTITDKIPHLLAAGIEPVVFSSVMGQPDPQVTHLQMLPWGPAGIRFDMRHMLARRLGRGGVYRVLILLVTVLLALPILVERLLVGLRSQWSWAIPALLRGRGMVRRGEVELVFSTGGVFSAHLAGYWLKRWTGCRWIVEVHDPLVIPGRAPKGRHERFLARVEERICRHADLAWWFTEGALAAARRRHPELGERGIVVLPGAEPPVVHTDYQHGSMCVFGHFGSLSPTRSLAPALEAIALLLTREPALREVLRLEVYGSALDPQATQLVESLNLAGVVLPIGRLEFDPATGLSGRARVMQRMQQCDVLLMMHGDIAEAREYIPSKLYEYFWARRPVLALTCENAQLETLVVGHGGWVAPTREVAAVVEAFAAAIGRWRNGGLPDVSVPPVTVADAVARILAAVERIGSTHHG